MMETIYQEMLKAGVEVSHHESDLYVRVTPESRRVIENYQFKVTAFQSEVDGQLWFDIPFAYDPWWTDRRNFG